MARTKKGTIKSRNNLSEIPIENFTLIKEITLDKSKKSKRDSNKRSKRTVKAQNTKPRKKSVSTAGKKTPRKEEPIKVISKISSKRNSKAKKKKKQIKKGRATKKDGLRRSTRPHKRIKTKDNDLSIQQISEDDIEGYISQGVVTEIMDEAMSQSSQSSKQKEVESKFKINTDKAKPGNKIWKKSILITNSHLKEKITRNQETPNHHEKLLQKGSAQRKKTKNPKFQNPTLYNPHSSPPLSNPHPITTLAPLPPPLNSPLSPPSPPKPCPPPSPYTTLLIYILGCLLLLILVSLTTAIH
ncbi:unnamed protein product [Moneuplotes crassus]|uniref:Uncharacterized protein n=1 Tax=Euplotes crassus TaxID=5936 RepID=A0AAD1XEK1_EUPCR|nr:unnamed protein product [Moneuplotes crassus]